MGRQHASCLPYIDCDLPQAASVRVPSCAFLRQRPKQSNLWPQVSRRDVICRRMLRGQGGWLYAPSHLSQCPTALVVCLFLFFPCDDLRSRSLSALVLPAPCALLSHRTASAALLSRSHAAATRTLRRHVGAAAEQLPREQQQQPCSACSSHSSHLPRPPNPNPPLLCHPTRSRISPAHRTPAHPSLLVHPPHTA